MNEQECGCVKCGWCCTDMEINILDLVFPDQLLPKKGLEFYEAHGLREILNKNGRVKIVHRCQHLTEENLCGIEEHKPDFCREWVCRRHSQDERWFKARQGEIAIKKIEEIRSLLISEQCTQVQDEVEAILHSYNLEVTALGGFEL